MSNSYDPNELSADKVMQVKHLIGDVYDFEFLSRQEIEFALDRNGDNIYGAAVDCCDAIAARLARNTDYRFSTLWQDSSQAMQHFVKLAERLDKVGASKSAVAPIFHSTSDDDDPIFDIGQFDNERGGTFSSSGTFTRE